MISPFPLDIDIYSWHKPKGNKKGRVSLAKIYIPSGKLKIKSDGFFSLTLENMINPIYFKTHFKTHLDLKSFKMPFCVITAFATTGETWSEEANLEANKALIEWLTDHKVWSQPIIGFDPNTGHSEAGFAVDLDWQQGCDLGLAFKQDAIYYVDALGKLFVTLCNESRSLEYVDSFNSRMSFET